MRATVMAALHFDFYIARQFGNCSDFSMPFNEDATNMQNYMNFLKQLDELSNKNGQGLLRDVQAKISQLKNLNLKVFDRVKNPYLKLFYVIMVEIENSKNSNKQQQRMGQENSHPLIEFSSVINLFDFVTVCCKYLDQDKLKQALEQKIE